MTDPSPHAGPSKPNRHPVNIRFAYVSPEEARREKVAVSARRAASKVYIKELGLTAKQNTEVLALYDSGGIPSFQYDPLSDEDQMAAAVLLAEIALDEDAQGAVGNRWSTKWSEESGGKKVASTKRVLYQWCVNARLKKEKQLTHLPAIAAMTTPLPGARNDSTLCRTPVVSSMRRLSIKSSPRKSCKYAAIFSTMRIVNKHISLTSPHALSTSPYTRLRLLN